MKPTGQHDPWTLILDELECLTKGHASGMLAQRVIIEFNRLAASNAKLLAACEEFLKAYDDMPEQYAYFKDAARLAHTAVAEASGVTPPGTPSGPHP
jgi:hypothetical protein